MVASMLVVETATHSALPVVPICRGRASLISPPNQQQYPAIPPFREGRIAIVTDVGRDAVDAAALLTNSA